MTGDETHGERKIRDKREMYRQRLICLGRTALIVLAASLVSLYLNWSGVMKENSSWSS